MLPVSHINTDMPQTQGNTKERIRTIQPELYDVVMLNDDFTTQDFVVYTLINIFYKSAIEAERLMLEIHHKGEAVVGTYTLDIAKSKMDKAMSFAR